MQDDNWLLEKWAEDHDRLVYELNDVGIYIGDPMAVKMYNDLYQRHFGTLQNKPTEEQLNRHLSERAWARRVRGLEEELKSSHESYNALHQRHKIVNEKLQIAQEQIRFFGKSPWLPVSTIPKDGTPIQRWLFLGETSVTVKYDPFYPLNPWKVVRSDRYKIGDVFSEEAFTPHWMPEIEPPPQVETKTAMDYFREKYPPVPGTHLHDPIVVSGKYEPTKEELKHIAFQKMLKDMEGKPYVVKREILAEFHRLWNDVRPTLDEMDEYWQNAGWGAPRRKRPSQPGVIRGPEEVHSDLAPDIRFGYAGHDASGNKTEQRIYKFANKTVEEWLCERDNTGKLHWWKKGDPIPWEVGAGKNNIKSKKS